VQRLEIIPFDRRFETQVIDLIVDVQRTEFGIEIAAEQQPDLSQIPQYYQVRAGNFWIALSDGKVVGTISLLDIGESQGALRKMFVHRDFRGDTGSVARRLLGTLITWAGSQSLCDIFLGTTSQFVAAHRFYEKNGFSQIAKASLPPAFPVMEVDTKFYHRAIQNASLMEPPR
jgi:N-acetylglutamate synthase-like GNAT family acetyltransferase